MKKIIILSSAIFVILILSSCTLPGGKNINRQITPSPATNNPLACKIAQDCIDKKITCGANKRPYCQIGSLATGEKYPEPICVCLNPNLEY